MGLRVRKPQSELGVLVDRLYQLDFNSCGPKWMYLPKERSKTLLERARLVRMILELDPEFNVPDKKNVEDFYHY